MCVCVYVSHCACVPASLRWAECACLQSDNTSSQVLRILPCKAEMHLTMLAADVMAMVWFVRLIDIAILGSCAIAVP